MKPNEQSNKYAREIFYVKRQGKEKTQEYWDALDYFADCSFNWQSCIPVSDLIGSMTTEQLRKIFTPQETFEEVRVGTEEYKYVLNNSREPISCSNNQRTWTEVHEINGIIYHLTWGLEKHIVVERKVSEIKT